MLEVNITSKCVFDDSKLVEHIRENQKRNLPGILPMAAREGALSMCASGPSLANNLDELRALNLPIVASNGAHDYLIEQGFNVDYGCAVDPTDIERFKLKNHETHYFLASQCDPRLFDNMIDYNVIMFNVAFCNDLDRLLEVFGKHPVLGGGSTTGLKAIALFYAAGYRKFHLFGYDGSFSKDKRRVTGESIPDNSMYVHPGHDDANGNPVVSDNQYLSCPEMAIQATELSIMMNSIISDAEIIPHGDGLIQETLRMRKTLGYTKDIHRLRPETAGSLPGSGSFHSDSGIETSINLSPHIVATADKEARTD